LLHYEGIILPQWPQHIKNRQAKNSRYFDIFFEFLKFKLSYLKKKLSEAFSRYVALSSRLMVHQNMQ